MKKYFILALMVFLMLCGIGINNVFALSFDNNITVWDGVRNSGYDGGSPAIGQGGEDNETERSDWWLTYTDQEWDLEGMFIDGNSIIVVGGFNFQSGVDSGDDHITIGNLFFGDLDYYSSTADDTKNGADSTFTPKYVLADDKNIYDGNFTTDGTEYFSASDPYKYSGDGTPTDYGWSVDYGTVNGLFSDWDDDTQNPGDYGDDHYYMQFIIDEGFWSLIANDPDAQYVHLTMTCGNDSIDGQVAPVPEPTTILLSGLGLLGMGVFIRRKRKLESEVV